MDTIAAVWDIVSTARIEVLVVALLLLGLVAWVAVTLIGYLLDFIGVLVRGHAPAEVDAEVVEALADLHERTEKLVDYAHDSFNVLDRTEDALIDLGANTAQHAERVEELLAQLVAATRATTLAVVALDDDEPIRDAVELQLSAYAREPKAYAEAAAAGRVPGGDFDCCATPADEHAPTAAQAAFYARHHAYAYGTADTPPWTPDTSVDLAKRDDEQG
jgi:hypothetical protein